MSVPTWLQPPAPPEMEPTRRHVSKDEQDKPHRPFKAYRLTFEQRERERKRLVDLEREKRQRAERRNAG